MDTRKAAGYLLITASIGVLVLLVVLLGFLLSSGDANSYEVSAEEMVRVDSMLDRVERGHLLVTRDSSVLLVRSAHDPHSGVRAQDLNDISPGWYSSQRLTWWVAYVLGPEDRYYAETAHAFLRGERFYPDTAAFNDPHIQP